MNQMQEIREKVAKENGYATWDKMIETCCQKNTAFVIHRLDEEVMRQVNFIGVNPSVLRSDFGKKVKIKHYYRGANGKCPICDLGLEETEIIEADLGETVIIRGIEINKGYVKIVS